MIRLFEERRNAIVEELRRVPGFEVAKPLGAFYAFPRVAKLLSELGMSVEELVDKILYEKAVATLPGTAFPDKAGKDYIRFSFAVSVERIREGVKRIRELVEDLLARSKR